MSHQAVRAIVIKDKCLLVMKRNKFGQQYYTLPGGGINLGEQAEAALRREIREEASLELGALRHVFTEDAGDPYGVQYIFLAEYKSGEPTLAPDSEEAKINELGQNLYEPQWLPLDRLAQINFLSASLQAAIGKAQKSGYPKEPEVLVWQAASVAS
jgi:ADP-ribose pyrophosphatase YjhB (NUDIX family)